MRRRILMITAVFLSAISGTGQTTSKPAAMPEIDQLMSAAEFRAAGLQKLSAEELAALNIWLAKYTKSIAAVVNRPPIAPTLSSAEIVESHIDGDFEGWDGETVFKLDNGQIWQQASYSYTYHYAYHPKVLIYRSGGGYKMKVDGVEQTLPVTRLK